MIKFNFTVSDEEAQSIFDCIQSCIDKADEEVLNTAGEVQKWWQSHAKYLRALQSKLDNIKLD